MMIYFTF